MKEFQLSTQKERTASIAFSVAAICCFALLLFALRGNTAMLILCGLCVTPVTAILVFYIFTICKSRCVLNTQTKVLEVRGFPTNYTRDLSEAILVQTFARKSGHTTSRVIIFSDKEENIIATIPTLFTYKQGVMADPLAKEMAEALGIEFQANVPAWYYDKEAFKQHQIEEAQREKEEREERKKMRTKKLMYRYRKK